MTRLRRSPVAISTAHPHDGFLEHHRPAVQKCLNDLRPRATPCTYRRPDWPIGPSFAPFVGDVEVALDALRTQIAHSEFSEKLTHGSTLRHPLERFGRRESDPRPPSATRRTIRECRSGVIRRDTFEAQAADRAVTQLTCEMLGYHAVRDRVAVAASPVQLQRRPQAFKRRCQLVRQRRAILGERQAAGTIAASHPSYSPNSRTSEIHHGSGLIRDRPRTTDQGPSDLGRCVRDCYQLVQPRTLHYLRPTRDRRGLRHE